MAIIDQSESDPLKTQSESETTIVIELHGVVNCHQVHEILDETGDGLSPAANVTFASRFAGIAAIVTAGADCFPALVASCWMGLFDQKKTESPLVAVMNDVHCIWDPRMVSETRTGLK